VGGLGVGNDKRLAKQLLNEQGFDVDEERIHIPSTEKRRVEVHEIQNRRQGARKTRPCG
jgi:hypothetical protein